VNPARELPELLERERQLLGLGLEQLACARRIVVEPRLHQAERK
jgi:hypothetical protein